MKDEEVVRAFMPGQWWALLSPLGIMKVVGVTVEPPNFSFTTHVWRAPEAPASEWTYSDHFVPDKCRYLWFRLPLGKVEGHQTGEVRISALNERLFFMVVEGEEEVSILADWEVDTEHYSRSYLYQEAPVDPNKEPPGRLERVLNEG